MGCYRCGKNDHDFNKCSEDYRSCYNCGNQGHIFQKCPQIKDVISLSDALVLQYLHDQCLPEIVKEFCIVKKISENL